MFILDPVNAITSVQFYRKVAVQSMGRTIAYLMYLSALFTASFLVFCWLRIVPPFKDLMGWMAQNVPPMTFGDGKVTSAVDTPKVVRHPSFPELGVMIDTTRTESVTPQMMEENKVRVYITGNAMYLVTRPGRVEVNDLSKTTGPPMEIGPAFYREFAKVFPLVIYAVAGPLAFSGFLLWRACATLFYWLAASLLNASMDAGLRPEALASIAVYGQTLPSTLFTIMMFTPGGLNAGTTLVAGFAITAAYITLAVGAVKKASAPPAAV